MKREVLIMRTLLWLLSERIGYTKAQSEMRMGGNELHGLLVKAVMEDFVDDNH